VRGRAGCVRGCCPHVVISHRLHLLCNFPTTTPARQRGKCRLSCRQSRWHLRLSPPRRCPLWSMNPQPHRLPHRTLIHPNTCLNRNPLRSLVPMRHPISLVPLVNPQWWHRVCVVCRVERCCCVAHAVGHGCGESLVCCAISTRGVHSRWVRCSRWCCTSS
jgi:hypothetical protein